ncbi:hypothetical protein GCM10027413_00590 [Conyzicola nivalis]|uniref:Uncharacterized protein n=1 Tax=Conyzicola nivalis TaxID=1477021 RepID=A0A916WLS3_9MICO|nr:hypothetical protein [Conyzicola nivalis]GGB10214.1 hypothetical protein GCM10010979_26050 [Conyzicola nivalis]
MKPPSPSALRRFVVAGLVLAGVISVIAVTYTVLPTPASTPMPGVAAPTGKAGDDASSAPEDGDPLQPVPFEPAPLPVGPRTTTEVEATAPDDGRQPAPDALAPLLTGGVPVDAAARKKLVAGFPDLIPIAEPSTLVASSVSSSEGRVQATLEATTTQSPAQVTEYYRTVFAALSLQGVTAPSVGGSTGTVFALGDGSVTLTVRPDGDGARYSLFGAITVAP